MLSHEDLDAAVAAGIVTAPQREALRDFAAKREHARLSAQGHEERFRFMRGFNDFFFATGVVMLGAGMMFFAEGTFGGNFVAALVVWGLAELLVKRMRLVLPGILLACLFVAFVYRWIPINLWDASPVPGMQRTIGLDDLLFGRTATPPQNVLYAFALKTLVGTAAAALFYARFRLPFSLLLIAGSLVAAILAVATVTTGATARTLVLLPCGLAVFAAAMTFDMSDRERTTRRSDCAFWLHLLAAPLIVHSLVSMVASDVSVLTMSTAAAMTIVAIVALLAVVAVVIDRRALLVSTLSYLGLVIAHAIRTSGATTSYSQGAEFFMTLVILGVLVLVLGVGWLPLRRALIAVIPLPLLNRLPPAVPA